MRHVPTPYKFLYGANNISGDGIALAIAGANLADKIVSIGVDSDSQEIQALADGELDLIIVQDAYGQGYSAMKNAIETLTEECVLGITVNKEHCMEMVKNSIGIVTALNPYIGYKTSSKVAKEAFETNRSVYEIVLEKGLMTQDKLDEALDPAKMLSSHKFIK